MKNLRDLSPSKDIILIVDDIPENLRFLSCLLSQQGYDIRAAINGRMALGVLKSTIPSLILLDVLMPEMSGYDICRRLKADPQTCDIPVIFLSALDDVQDKINAFDAGGIDYITKPFHGSEVLARVKTHLTLRHLQQQLQIANQELQCLVNIDGLTLVANRRRFDEYLEQEWNRLARGHLPLSLILCDVDFFKNFNDIYGHLAGDECLCNLATLLKESIRHPEDLVARYGGEEFAIILPNTPLTGALHVVKNIQSAVQLRQQIHSGSTISSYVTFSLGVATMMPAIGQSASQIVAAADKALYQAKVDGRDRVRVYELSTRDTDY